MKPKYLILDEPTAGLDPKGKSEILEQLARLHREQKMTIILVSHSMEDIARYVERIVVINQGKKMYDAVPEEVFFHYKELEKIGLQAPEITYILQELKAKGFPIQSNIFTVEQAKEEIKRVLL